MTYCQRFTPCPCGRGCGLCARCAGTRRDHTVTAILAGAGGRDATPLQRIVTGSVTHRIAQLTPTQREQLDQAHATSPMTLEAAAVIHDLTGVFVEVPT